MRNILAYVWRWRKQKEIANKISTVETSPSFWNLWLANESIFYYLFAIKGIIQVCIKTNYVFGRQFYKFIFSKSIMIKIVKFTVIILFKIIDYKGDGLFPKG